MMHAKYPGVIKVGWVHNPNYVPQKDVVRLFVRSSDGRRTDQHMTPLEAMSIAAGLMLTVSHHGWTGELQKLGIHFEPGEDPMALPGYEKCDGCGNYVEVK